MLPAHRDTPKIAKMVKKNKARTATPPSCDTEASNVEIKIFIEGIVVKLLRGLISLKVLMPLTDYI
jgi:hypothetical protein